MGCASTVVLTMVQTSTVPRLGVSVTGSSKALPSIWTRSGARVTGSSTSFSTISRRTAPAVGSAGHRGQDRERQPGPGREGRVDRLVHLELERDGELAVRAARVLRPEAVRVRRAGGVDHADGLAGEAG